MTIAKITGPGLAAMGASVALLWACLLGEHMIARHAAEQEALARHQIQSMRQRQQAEPVVAPVPRPHRLRRPSAG